VIPIGDRPPDLDVRKVSRHGYVIGTPVDMFAKYTDLDDVVDGHPAVTVTWLVVAPTVSSDFTFVDLAPDLSDPLNPVVGKRLTPGTDPTTDVGEWRVEITAMDPEAATNQQLLTVDVVADHPPCIAEVAPIVPPAGTSLPLSEPTLFSVPVVIDDLDVYPPDPSDPILGVTRFSWTIMQPGTSSFQPFGTADAVDFDPAGYHPGDVVQIRVEIFDRKNTGIACDVADPTCSVISDPTCIQRQTWQVEVQ